MPRFALALPAASAAVSLLLAAPALGAARGRVFDPEKRLRIDVLVGEVSTLEGLVDETTRPLFEVTGQPELQSRRESFSFSELGLRTGEATYGLGLELMGKWVTLQAESTFMRAEARGIAVRDFYIGVGEVRFDGRPYEYQLIDRGAAYVADLDAMLLGVRGLVTPVTLSPGGRSQFVPWVSLGLFSFVGDLDVDAGPARAVVQYENPPRDYVQGGRSTGDATAFVPELGVGGELRTRVGERAGQPISLVLQGGYSIFEFHGSTGDLGISSRNEKNLDVGYASWDARAMFEWPMSGRYDLVAGAGFRSLRADALSEAKDRSLEETLVLREKFDKQIDLEITRVNALVGVRW